MSVSRRLYILEYGLSPLEEVRIRDNIYRSLLALPPSSILMTIHITRAINIDVWVTLNLPPEAYKG